MNEIVSALGLAGWKGLVGTALLPPVPMLVLVLAGAWQLPRRRRLGWALVWLGCAALWALSTTASARWLRQTLVPVPPALTARDLADLQQAASSGPPTAIVVLGGGRRALAPEYGQGTLAPIGLERLRYGVWLAQRTGLPLAFSGGIGHGAEPGDTEARIAARVAAQELRHPLRWTEDSSRDTSESGQHMVRLLQAEGIQRIVLVTHDYHQRRALRAFQRGAAAGAQPLALLPAPLGVLPDEPLSAADFLPTRAGATDNWLLLHEWLGWIAGA